MKYLSADELDRMIQNKEEFQLVDVRESYEFEDENIGGDNIPLADILEQTNRIESDKPVIFCCKTGKRSAAMTMTLERKFGMTNLHTLQGGLENYFELKK